MNFDYGSGVFIDTKIFLECCLLCGLNPFIRFWCQFREGRLMCARQVRYPETSGCRVGKGLCLSDISSSEGCVGFLSYYLSVSKDSWSMRRTDTSLERANFCSKGRGSNLSCSTRHKPEGDAQSHWGASLRFLLSKKCPLCKENLNCLQTLNLLTQWSWVWKRKNVIKRRDCGSVTSEPQK